MDKWKCTDGVTRDLDKMPPMHLGMICKMLETKDTNYNRYKLNKIGSMLIDSGLTVNEWIENIKAIREGRFKFYEDSPVLDEYYRKLVCKYKIFLAPRCIQFKDNYPQLNERLQMVYEKLGTLTGEDSSNPNKTQAAEMMEEIRKIRSNGVAKNYFEGNVQRIKDLADLSNTCEM